MAPLGIATRITVRLAILVGVHRACARARPRRRGGHTVAVGRRIAIATLITAGPALALGLLGRLLLRLGGLARLLLCRLFRLRGRMQQRQQPGAWRGVAGREGRGRMSAIMWARRQPARRGVSRGGATIHTYNTDRRPQRAAKLIRGRGPAHAQALNHVCVARGPPGPAHPAGRAAAARLGDLSILLAGTHTYTHGARASRAHSAPQAERNKDSRAPRTEEKQQPTANSCCAANVRAAGRPCGAHARAWRARGATSRLRAARCCQHHVAGGTHVLRR